MSIAKVYAVISTANLGAAREWFFGDGGVQVVADAKRAGDSMLTIIVPDMNASRAEPQSRNLALGPFSSSDFATIAQINDSDGNQITFAEPGPDQQL
jgi:hypothetical protein